MQDSVLIVHERYGIRPLLCCGHYGPWMSPQSSRFDFPDEPVWCPECEVEFQMHPLAQTMIYEEHG